jgi:hypothetical protein
VRPLAVALLLALAVGATGCGLGDKEALADRIAVGLARLDDGGLVDATVAASITVVPSDQPAVPGPPRIIPARLDPVPSVLDLRRDQAAVGLTSPDPSSAAVVFLGGDLYQRIPPKTVTQTGDVPSSAATNLAAIVANFSAQAVAAQAEQAAPGTDVTAPPEPTTTTAPSALRRTPRIPRQWIAFDYDALDDKDTTKRAGSLAINPVLLLELTRGVLTGSLERVATDEPGLTLYEANVNRDKAERRLSEERRKLIDKIYVANAVSKRTFPARIWLDDDGNLRRFEVTLRQALNNIDRADLLVTIDVSGVRDGGPIPKPDSKATASVGSLGQLVTAVSSA